MLLCATVFSIEMKRLPMKSLCLFMCVAVAATMLPESATAQNRTPWETAWIRGTPEPPPEFRIQRAVAQHSFDKPTSISEIPGSHELLVTQMNGRIYTVAKKADGDLHTVADLGQLAGGAVSLFSAVLHPQFSENGLVFTCAVHPENGRHTRVSRFQTKRNRRGQLVADGSSETVIITWPAGGHNAGCLQFGPDGLLYISTGDGAGPNPPDGRTTGQTVDDLLGAILRIDVDRTTSDRNYAIPADNPFTGRENTREEIFAYGLRNPWKFGIDSDTGDVFVADNGWETWEMVHHVRSGQNCGWPVMEGRAELRTEVSVGPTPIVPPARDHHHSEANSVIGGPVYRGGKLPGLAAHFVYGDYITGTIWALQKEGEGYNFRDVVDTDLRIVDFAQGSEGELYVLDYDFTGGIYEVLPNSAEDLSADFPKLLSRTGLFESLKPLNPNPGVEAYDVVAPRWQDGAVASRWVAIPGHASISALGSTDVQYPEGTVFVKHLDVPTSPPTRLETQILHLNNGRWNPYSYIWDEDGNDASLVQFEGTTKAAHFPTEAPMTWKASARNECRLCHNAGSGFVLGFQPNQLQREIEQGLSHFASLQSRGVLTSSLPPNKKLSLVDPHDEDQSLNDRARSYLHANCSSCHHKGGNAIVSFYLRRDLPFDELNTNKGTGIGTFGMSNAKIIAPGDPFRSVLLYRMAKLGYARMPYIGSQVVDSRGVALISKWILSLSDKRDDRTSPPLARGSSESKTLAQLQVDAPNLARRTAIENLVQSTEGALAVLTRLHADELPRADREWALAAVREKSSDIRGLFDTFLPEAQRKETLGLTFDPQEILSRRGDPRRGKLVFFTNNQRCRLCHDVKNPEKSMGPPLIDIAKKYPRRSELLQHVMKPSLKVDDKYATWVVVTKDGRVTTGLRIPSDSGITLQRYRRETVTFSENEIEETAKAKASFMPDGVLTGLTAQEAADLLAYIQSLAPAASN